MADLTITAANVVKSSAAQLVSCVFGETVAAGELVYQHTDGKIYKADTDDANKKAVIGIAACSGSLGQPGYYIAEDPDLAIGTHGAALGTILVASGTAGKICPAADLAAGDYTAAVGIAKTATTIQFRILTAGVAIPA